VNALETWKLAAGGTIRDALGVLDRGGVGVALVCDPQDVLLGILTDGDLRRALLAGATLDSLVEPFLVRSFVRVAPGETRANVLDRMRALRISEIPIVDGAGRPVGLHLLHDMVSTQEVQSWAVVMAGGKGTRLAPLTHHLPKPMIPVAGRPILERIVLHLVGAGIRRIFLSVNYLAHMVEDHFGDGAGFGCKIEYLRETKPLGTGGALSLLPDTPTAPLLVMNGDLVTQFDVAAILAKHDASGAAATVAARRYFHTVPFGCMTLDGERLTQMEEKPTLSRMVNAGIYVVSPELVARVPRETEYTMPALLDDCLQRREIVTAWELQDDWIDVGQREQLKQARGEGNDG
jgi:dTDP-glucose pyrophosphorylase